MKPSHQGQEHEEQQDRVGADSRTCTLGARALDVDRSPPSASGWNLLPAAIALLLAHTACAEPIDTGLVHAQSDLVAARRCQEMNLPFMARLGPRDVVCFASLAGVPKDFHVVRVEDVLKGDAK